MCFLLADVVTVLGTRQWNQLRGPMVVGRTHTNNIKLFWCMGSNKDMSGSNHPHVSHRKLINQTLPRSILWPRHSSRRSTKQGHEKHTCLTKQFCNQLQACRWQLNAQATHRGFHPNMPQVRASLQMVLKVSRTILSLLLKICYSSPSKSPKRSRAQSSLPLVLWMSVPV